MSDVNPTDRIFLRDAQCRAFDATVVAVDGDGRVALDATAFYATSGGQPHDTGTLSLGRRRGDGDRREGPRRGVAHPRGPGPAGGNAGARGARLGAPPRPDAHPHRAAHPVRGDLQHLGRVGHRRQHGPAVGPHGLRVRVPCRRGSQPRSLELVNAEIAADRPIEISFLPRAEALADEDLIRTKVNLIPESVTEIRVVDIVGLDKQADGGTHLPSTGEVGRFEVVKTESKGKANKRLRIAVHDA